MNPNNDFLQTEMSKLYDYLQHLNAQENPVDFDISVDDLLVVPRTTSLENFDKYKPFLRDTSLCVKVRIYFGKSRGSKQFTFKTPYAYQNEQTQQNGVHSERLKMSYVNAVSKERFTEYKYKEVKRKNKQLKRENEALRVEVAQLKESGSNNSMLGSLGGVLAPLLADKFPKAASALNGIENKEIIDVMQMLQQRLTEDEFNTVMGINLAFSQYKGLINDVSNHLNEHYRK